MKRLALIVVALAFTGCGDEIDGDKLESEITKDADERLSLVLDGVDCPSPDVEEGATFTCTVTVKGQPTELEVTQIDDDGNVRYDLAGLAEGPATGDTAADETSVRAVIDAVNQDVTALCDYAVPEFRKELAKDESCVKSVLAKYETPLLEDYDVSIMGDAAAASGSDGTVGLGRQKDGSWLITDVR
jgi:uncharacterized protein DUF4333